MPKELTHWIISQRACDGMTAGSRIGSIIREHHRIYLAGAVLPDTLLHLFRGPHAAAALALAHRFHDTCGNSYAPLIAAERRHGGELPPPLLACLLGVITHMQTDMTFHPLVYALTDPDDMGGHYRVETAIDVHFLGKGFTPPTRLVADLVDSSTSPHLVDILGLLFDPEETLPRSAREQALRLHCRFQAMYDRTPWKLAVRLLARLAGPPFRDQLHLFYPLASSKKTDFVGEIAEWRHPCSGEPMKKSLKILADDATAGILKTFNSIEKEGKLSPSLETAPGANLLTGMHGACHYFHSNNAHRYEER